MKMYQRCSQTVLVLSWRIDVYTNSSVGISNSQTHLKIIGREARLGQLADRAQRTIAK